MFFILHIVVITINIIHTKDDIDAIRFLFIKTEKAYIKTIIKMQTSIDCLVLKFIKIYLQNLKINNIYKIIT